MPGQYQWSVDLLPQEVEEIAALGIPAVILFGVPANKDAVGSEGFATEGIVQKAIGTIKQAVPDLVVITDVCLCQYTSHGHCGLIKGSIPGGSEFAEQPGSGRLRDGSILNDETLAILGAVALSHAEAGADMVAPSEMMDGMVGVIRQALDRAGYGHVGILSYAAKYASSFYGPFRDAAQSSPAFGDRRCHQMDPSNAREALREVAMDIGEGADIIMVKPALPYPDIIRQVRDQFGYPVAAYSVSGEFSMIKAASERGWIDERAATLEALTSIKRAGADLIVTYSAKDAARWFQEAGYDMAHPVDIPNTWTLPRLMAHEPTADCSMMCRQWRTSAQPEPAADELTWGEVKQLTGKACDVCDIEAYDSKPTLVVSGGHVLVEVRPVRHRLLRNPTWSPCGEWYPDQAGTGIDAIPGLGDLGPKELERDAVRVLQRDVAPGDGSLSDAQRGARGERRGVARDHPAAGSAKPEPPSQRRAKTPTGRDSPRMGCSARSCLTSKT